jgi:hypothetical protein
VWYLKLISCEKCKYAPKVYIKRHDQYSMFNVYACLSFIILGCENKHRYVDAKGIHITKKTFCLFQVIGIKLFSIVCW